MKTSLLPPHKDPMGSAIADYFAKGKSAKLRVLSSQFEEDEIPTEQLFRTYDEMPLLEQEALQLAQGKILDCGAGSGCHALALQDMGKDVEAIDISPLSVEVMQKRGVKNAYCINLFDENYLQKFDTILMLMNGSGIIGKLENMGAFFTKMKQLLNPGDASIWIPATFAICLRMKTEASSSTWLVVIMAKSISVCSTSK